MTSLGKVANIWDRPAEGSSNAQKAAIYVERARLIIAQLLEFGAAHPAVHEGTIARRAIAELIGCGQATLMQNRGIRKLLEDAERVLQQTSGQGHVYPQQYPRSVLSAQVLHKATLFSGSKYSKIVLTTSEFKAYGRSFPKVPVILFSNGVHEAGSDWLSHLCVENRIAPSSARQYAKLLRAFFERCRAWKQNWKTANDGLLIRYREYLEDERQGSHGHINECLGVIFRFYVYCETNGILKYRVGCYHRTDLPESLRLMPFPISAIAVPSRPGRRTTGWDTPIKYRTTESSLGNRATPTSEEIASAHRIALTSANALRNTLMMSWAEDTGARRAEILQIKVAQIPSLERVDKLVAEENGWLGISVVRKGGKIGVLRAQPDTLYATLAWLRVRAGLVSYFKKTKPGYREPPELFISRTEGSALKPDTLTKLVGKIFRESGLVNANIHRLRARFAVDLTEALLDEFLEQGLQVKIDSNWVETILQQVAIRMGHKNPASLRHYLTIALERRIRVAYAAGKIAQRNQERNASEVIHSMTAMTKFLRRLQADVDGFDSKAAAGALRKHADELEIA